MARLQNPLAGFWAGLSARERTLIMALVMVFFVMATVVLLFLRGSRLSESRRKIEGIENALYKLRTQGAVYQERLEKKKEREARISTETILFSTLLEEAITKVDDVSVSNQEDQPTVELDEGLKRRAVEFDLRSVTLDDLVKFLTAVEQKPGHVILTSRLLIRSPSQSEDRLNTEIEVATWERTKTEEPEAEAEE